MTQVQEQEFRRFLEGVRWRGRPLTETAIETRIRRGRDAENILGIDMEAIVASDVTMRQALIDLRAGDVHGGRANAVRKYYEMRRGNPFPRLRDAF